MNASYRVPVFVARHEHVLMDCVSFDQITVGDDVFGDGAKYLKPNMQIKMELYEGRPIIITLPNTVDLKVMDTQPEIKWATQSAQAKPATLETGAVVYGAAVRQDGRGDPGGHPHGRVRHAGKGVVMALQSLHQDPVQDLRFPQRAAGQGLHAVARRAGALERRVQALDDQALLAKTAEFKAALAGGQAARGILPEAFAVVREAARRNVEMRHFDVQLVGGNVLYEGKIAEMATGEGKTLVATLAAYLVHLTGRQGPHRHGQRLPGQARRRVDGADLQGPGADGRRDPGGHGLPRGRSARASTSATSPTAPTTSSASTTCATT